MDSRLEHEIPPPLINQRYEGLDQLRGILAFSVMIYHYAEWHRLPLPWMVQKPLDLLGIYAVSTFYTLSGCALYIVYRNRSIDRDLISEFWIKRIFRIVPLFWLVTIFTILTQKGAGQEWSAYVEPWRIFVNFSLLFSWLDPGAYYATGAWSIGNEWAFYTLFPLILWALRGRISTGIMLGSTALATAWFAFHVIGPRSSVEAQWKVYINPLNQLVLFVAGIMLGPRITQVKPMTHLPYQVHIGVLTFVLISYFATVPECISGFWRLILVGICVLCCEGFAVTRFKHGRFSRVLTFLGSISYTVYLMHPIVHHGVSKILGKIQSIVGINTFSPNLLSSTILSASIVFTIVFSSLIYQKLEKPAVKLGRSMATRFKHQGLTCGI